MAKSVLGIIGGSGIYDLPGLEKARSNVIVSPWGDASGPLMTGEIDGLPVVFPSRHDKGHRVSPTDINYRANIDVLERAGVTDLVSLSACGSFKEYLPPGTFVLVDQFVDRTHKRESSFFGKGCVAHVSMAHPVSPRLRIHIAEAAMAEGINARRHLCLHRRSAILDSRRKPHLQESRLCSDRHDQHARGQARPRGGDLLCDRGYGHGFRLLWHPDHDAVTVQDIIKVLVANAQKGTRLVTRLAREFPREHESCPIGSDRALDNALITAPDARDPDLLKKLDAVAGRVLGK
jgi:5'-methylthioadenosine phosphorylase